jgi:hypothetical protein
VFPLIKFKVAKCFWPLKITHLYPSKSLLNLLTGPEDDGAEGDGAEGDVKHISSPSVLIFFI